MKYNNEFSIIDTEEKAYFLGQAYGDGYNSDKHGYKFLLASNEEDIELYQKLSQLFPFLKYKKYKSHPNMIYLESHEKALVKDLIKLGLISNKTDNDKLGKFHFPELKQNLIPHFIRGYFDADGSFWFPNRKRSRNSLHTDFGCSTKNFLLEIKKHLDTNGIKFTYNERLKSAGNDASYITYNLYSSSRKLSQKFADYIYKDAHIYLQYKYDKSHQEKDLRTPAYIEFGVCPHCGSTNIKRNGTRNSKYRLYCTNCCKHFTKSMPTQKVTSNE